MDNTKFSISGSADDAPITYTLDHKPIMTLCVSPYSNEITCSKGIEVSANPIEIGINKEWVKRLLLEFINDVDENYGGDHVDYSISEIEKFLETSEVWNGKNN